MQKSQRSPQLSQNSQQTKFGRFSILQNESSANQEQKDFMFNEVNFQEYKTSDKASNHSVPAATKDTSANKQQPMNYFISSDDANPFDSHFNAGTVESHSSLSKNEQIENQAIIEMRKSTGNILQNNTDASCASPFTSHKMLTESNVNNFKPPQKTRTSWAPVNTQTDSKIQIPRLSGLCKIQQSTPSSLREFRSSAPTKLTPRSLFAFRSGGDNSALNQEEEEDSLFIEEKDIIKQVSKQIQDDDSPKDEEENEVNKDDDCDDGLEMEKEDQGNFLFEDSDENNEASINVNNESEIFNMFPQNKEQEDDDNDDSEEGQMKEASVQSEQKKSVSPQTMSSTKQEMDNTEIQFQAHNSGQAAQKIPSQNSSRSNRKISFNKLSSEKNTSGISSGKNSSYHNKSKELKNNFLESINSSQEKCQTETPQTASNLQEEKQKFCARKISETNLQSKFEILPATKPEFLQSKPNQQQLIDEDLISDVKLLQSISNKPQNIQQQFPFRGEPCLPQNIQEIPMDNEMKTQILKMRIAQEKVQVMPLDDSFSLLSNQIYKTIEKKKGGVSSFAQLNPKASNFSPQKKSSSTKKVTPNMTNNASLGSPLANALSRTASTTPSESNNIIPPPGFTKIDQQQSPEIQDQRKIHQNPSNIQVPSFEYHSPYSPLKSPNYQGYQNFHHPHSQYPSPYMHQQQPYVNLNPPQHPFSTPPISNQISPPPPSNFGYGYAPHYSPQAIHYQQNQAYNNSPIYNQYYDQATNSYINDYNSPRSPQNYSNMTSPLTPNFNNFYQPTTPSRGMMPNSGIPPMIGKGSDLPSAQVLLQTNAPVAFSDLLNNVLQIAVQQSGYKLIERQLHRIDPHSENGKTLFKKLLPHFDRISNDPLGNFLSQSLIQIYFSQYIRSFYNALRPNFLTTCQNIHGTRVIQKVISIAHSKQDVILNNEGQQVLRLFKQDISGLVKTISSSIHGNYVIQKALEQGGEKERKMLADEILNNLKIILPDLFEHASRQDQDKVVDYITVETGILRELIFNQYGNYVVQKALQVLPKASKRFGLLMFQVKKILPQMRESASTNSQISQIYGRFLKKYPELQHQSHQNLNSKIPGASLMNGGGAGYHHHQQHNYNHHYHNNNNNSYKNNYHHRGHSGKKQPFRNGRNVAAGVAATTTAAPGYMVMNSPKSELTSYHQQNYFVNSPPLSPNPATNFQIQQVGNYMNQGYGSDPQSQQIFHQAKYYTTATAATTTTSSNNSGAMMMGEKKY